MNDQPNSEALKRPVPFACRMLMYMALTYYGVINLLFFGMLIFSGQIRKATEPWFEEEGFNHLTLLLFIVIGLLVLLLCTSGIFLMLKQRKGGFYLFLAGAVFLWITDFFLLEFDWIRYLINSGFIFILGFLHFSGKCYKKAASSKKKGHSTQ